MGHALLPVFAQSFQNKLYNLFMKHGDYSHIDNLSKRLFPYLIPDSKRTRFLSSYTARYDHIQHVITLIIALLVAMK